MVTATLEDLATTTITFNGFKVINRSIEAKDFTVVPYPDDEGIEVLFPGSFTRRFKCIFIFLDDSNFPGAGDSAATKRRALEDFYMSGGDNDYLFKLTLDSEESIPSAPVIEEYNGKIKILSSRAVAGKNVSSVDGTFEFWEDTIN